MIDNTVILRPDAHAEAERARARADKALADAERAAARQARQEHAVADALAADAAEVEAHRAAERAPDRQARRRCELARDALDAATLDLGKLVASGASAGECTSAIAARDIAQRECQMADAALAAILAGFDADREAERRADRRRELTADADRLDQVVGHLEAQRAFLAELERVTAVVRAVPDSLRKPSITRAIRALGSVGTLDAQLTNEIEIARHRATVARDALANMGA